VGAVAGFGVTTYNDRASARSRAYGAPSSTARSVRVLWRAETDRKVMALTFDDGPGDKLTRPLLDALREERVPATFSLVGREATTRRNIVKQQLTDGHELANHTWSHPDLSLLPLDELSRELERTDQLFYELSGKRPRFIRPPFGRVSGALLQHAAANGQDVLLWDVRFKEASFDSAGNVTYVPEQNRARKHHAGARRGQGRPLHRDPGGPGTDPRGQGTGIRVRHGERDGRAGRRVSAPVKLMSHKHIMCRPILASRGHASG
jgi:peptidoglycan/xylan/chitin deacetylase (PgdA/CDA1 family)